MHVMVMHRDRSSEVNPAQLLPQDILPLPHRGMKGVAFTDALNKRDVCPALPEYGTPEYDSGPLDRLHASIPALLSSAATQQVLQGAEPVNEAQLVRHLRPS